MAERSDEEAPRESCGKPRMARVLGVSTFTSSLDEQEIEVSATSIDRYHGSYLMPSLEHATVADAMHPGILSCHADASLTDVARIMATHHVTASRRQAS
jgi:CBS domain-containing protein